MTSKRMVRGNRVLPGRALIVEDDALVAMDIAEALADSGAEQVVVCGSIAAALHEMEKVCPDLLVLDVRLADRDDGWSLAELANQLNPVPPFIVFSTGSPASIPPETAALGHVLVKPFPPEALVRLVSERRPAAGLLAKLRSGAPR
ncbi:response regulator [Novosphingobium olei]|uniref:response regulator n=1 Tax=Novosphingobium olei TaxID=2728851 RepID=UPI003091884B|nr:response regulator [Novosphingobium olei]